MSHVEEQIKETSELLQLVSFTIGSEEFGINILFVQEIIRMLQISKVPNSPSFVNGVINLRGRVIPVIDLRAKLRLERKKHDKNTRIIVVEVASKIVGFIEDAVREVLRIPKDITEAPPELVSGVNSEFIMAVAKLEDRLITLIDLEKISSSNGKQILSNAA